jgi:hypothetical protein
MHVRAFFDIVARCYLQAIEESQRSREDGFEGATVSRGKRGARSLVLCNDAEGPARKERLMEQHGLSQRRACRLVMIDHSTPFYRPKWAERAIRRWLRELEGLSFERTMPRMIVSDNGTELTSVAVLKWQSIASAQMRKLIEA